ncbi:MAG: enolase C-terminal domain-like protein, partial [Stellaceae bacterium]
MMPTPGEAPLVRVAAAAYEIPTDAPEADGTLEWDRTALVVVEIEAGGKTGLGYTYADGSIVQLIQGKLGSVISGHSVFEIAAANKALWRSIRNLGRSGLVATAISAVDAALWDLKARLLGTSVAALVGCRRNTVPIYGSGGFTTYSDKQLRDQMSGWVERDGCRWVKMKIGSDPAHDPQRVVAARDAIGDAGLFVDANGAFSAKQALALAERIAEYGVTWFEEPVSSDDLLGLSLMRERAPAGMDIAAGEYGYNLDDFRRLLALPSVDVL